MGTRTAPTAAEQAASEWIVLLESEDATREDRRRFQDWLRADPANQVAYGSVLSTWLKLDAVRLPQLAPPRRTCRMPAAAIAAMALIAMLVWQIAPTLPVYEASHAAQIGVQRELALPDGSTIELDAGTAVKVRYTRRERRVTLGRGAALFDVRPDAERRFVVSTEHGTIRVIGTSFAVHVGESDVRATVLRGVVQGQPRDAQGAIGALRALGGTETKSTGMRGEELLVTARQVTVTPAGEATVAQRLAWREGMLAFDRLTLSDAAADVTRHTGVSFEFSDAALGDARIVAYVSASDANRFIAYVEAMPGVNAERVSPDRVRFTGRSEDEDSFK
jgi:transmembrane sensor